MKCNELSIYKSLRTGSNMEFKAVFQLELLLLDTTSVSTWTRDLPSQPSLGEGISTSHQPTNDPCRREDKNGIWQKETALSKALGEASGSELKGGVAACATQVTQVDGKIW